MSRSSAFRLALAAVCALPLTAGTAGAIDLPFGFGGGTERARVAQQPAPVQLAQVSDGGVRISQMEEEMRRLTGKVEELGFLVLQLQEQLRKTQEDNEFRFQDLEKAGGGGDASAPQRRTEAAPATSPADPTRVASAPASPASSPMSDGSGPDEIGALLDTSLAEPLPAETPAAPAPSSQVASLANNGPGELYAQGYNYMLAGDYAHAENTFRQYTQAYPSSDDAPDAQYWLGEALYAQSKYRDAAEVFLNAQKSHPQSTKAPEMMLKLGMSLARLDNRETACVTYTEIGKRYPEMSSNVKRKLQAEEKSARCS